MEWEPLHWLDLLSPRGQAWAAKQRHKRWLKPERLTVESVRYLRGHDAIRREKAVK